MTSKLKIEKRTIENTEKGKSSFLKELVEMADLYKPVLNKLMTTHK